MAVMMFCSSWSGDRSLRALVSLGVSPAALVFDIVAKPRARDIGNNAGREVFLRILYVMKDRSIIKLKLNQGLIFE
jgi:hypothetical protein